MRPAQRIPKHWGFGDPAGGVVSTPPGKPGIRGGVSSALWGWWRLCCWYLGATGVAGGCCSAPQVLGGFFVFIHSPLQNPPGIDGDVVWGSWCESPRIPRPGVVVRGPGKPFLVGTQRHHSIQRRNGTNCCEKMTCIFFPLAGALPGGPKPAGKASPFWSSSIRKRDPASPCGPHRRHHPASCGCPMFGRERRV
ncbi:MAG: hypothetical protein CM15mP38_0140 [Synechococcus sp.]|nr:MAG: hypothetical protein CM15mP38_0140 [Synechococcus sp.]